jgi:hypothetical protein
MKNSPHSAAPAHWSKDFVEHLRSVHFALIVVSAGLILLALTAQAYNPKTASRQLDEIVKLKALWSAGWLRQNYKPDSIKPSPEPQLKHKEPLIALDTGQQIEKAAFLYREENGMPTPLALDFPKTPFSETILLSPSSTTSPNTGPAIWDGLEFPSTIYAFRKWWGQISTPQPVLVTIRIASEGILTNKDFVQGRVQLSEIQNLPITSKTQFHYVRQGDKDDASVADSLKFPVHGFSALIPDVNSNVFFPILEIEQVTVSQASLSKYFADWQPGPFDVAFSDLARAAHDKEMQDLESIGKIISQVTSQTAETFEAFGMKFPTDKIAIWGIFVLLCVQLYFLTYLRQLSGKLRVDDAGWDVPWIGMNQSLLAVSIFFVSLILLPLLAVVLLARQALYQSRDYVAIKSCALVSAFAVSLVIGILSWRSRPKLGQEESSATDYA